MYRMIIVEDNFFDMDDALSITDWGSLSVEVSASFNSARAALASVGELRPDIILTDIEMPEMGGMEFIKAAKEINPSVKVVIMSCYSEFEYAREALLLDVAAYITKPLMDREIRATFQPLIEKMNEERESIQVQEAMEKRLRESYPILKERFIRSFITENLYGEAELWEQIRYFAIPLEKSSYQMMVLEIDDYEAMQRDTPMEQKQMMEIKLWELVKKCLPGGAGETSGILTIQVDVLHFVLLFNVSGYRLLHGGTLTGAQFAGRLREQMKSSDLPGMTLVLGRVFDAITEASACYRECVDAMKHKFFVGKGQLLNLKELKEGQEAAAIDLEQLKQDIRKVLLSDRKDLVLGFMDRYFQVKEGLTSEYSVKNLTFSIIVCIQLLMEEINLDFEAIFAEEGVVWKKLAQFDTILDIRQWVKNIFFTTQNYIAEKNSIKSRKVVQTVKQFIEEHADKELTVQVVADEVFFSPNYLNSVFQHETGETIPEYIVKVRMEKAKKLLADTSLKLYEIVEKTGYRHTAYFNTLFKNYVGMTPKEYRECTRR